MKKAGPKGQERLLLTTALARFCDVEMPARNLSPQTRRGYTYDLTDWVATTPPSSPVAALSTDAISHYLSGLDERGLKGSTRHRKVAAIKTFLRYLEREGALPVDFSSRISWPEVQRDEPRALSQPEYTALLREAGHHPRDAAIPRLAQRKKSHASDVFTLIRLRLSPLDHPCDVQMAHGRGDPIRLVDVAEPPEPCDRDPCLLSKLAPRSILW